MTKTTFDIVVMSVINGLMLGIGYGSLIETFSDIGPVFLCAFFAHVIVMSYITVRGLMYPTVRKICDEQRDLLDNILEERQK